MLTLRIFLPVARYDTAQALALHRHALERIASLPGVESATIATNLPLLQLSMEVPFDLETAPPQESGGKTWSRLRWHWPRLLGDARHSLEARPHVHGRGQPNAPPVVMVNEAFAARYFPNQDPVGKRLQLNRPILGKDDFEDTIHPEIVGVVGNVKMGKLSAETGSHPVRAARAECVVHLILARHSHQRGSGRIDSGGAP